MITIDIDRILAAAARDMESGNWAGANAGYQRVLALAPGHADPMLQLSYLESLAGRYRAARQWAKRAAASDLPVRAEALVELVRRLRTFNEVVRLQDVVARLLRSPQTPHAVLVESARQLSTLGDYDAALRCAEGALRLAPVDPAARLVRGQLFAQQGRIDEAERELESVLERNPGIAIGWWMLSRLRKQTPESNHVASLQALLRTPGLRAADVAAAARALHKELDDLGDHDGAWRALETMCRARREGLDYDAQRSRVLVDDLIAWDPGGARCRAEARGDDRRVPVFIVGMHRSGTTLLEQLLDASAQVHGIGELNDFTAAMRNATDHHCRQTVDRTIVQRASRVDFADVGREYMQGIEWRLGDEAFFTDKQPANFLNVGFILRALPQAKILHLVRDPMETCFSNLRELFSDINPFSYDQQELADYFLQYRRLMAHWHLAFPGRIMDVPYAGLTTDTEATMRAVAAYCGIDYSPRMSDPRASKRTVATASSIQVRDKVVRREVPKWKAYAPQLQPLLKALQENGVSGSSSGG